MEWSTAFDLTRIIAQRVSITGRLSEHYKNKADVDGYHLGVLVMVNYKDDRSLGAVVYGIKMIRIEMEASLLREGKIPASLSLNLCGPNHGIGYKTTFYFGRDFLPEEIKSFFDKNNIQTRKEGILLVEQITKMGVMAEMPDSMPHFLSDILHSIHRGVYPIYN